MQAQELFSLDEWVKAQGLTPAIDGGTAGTQSGRTAPAANAFNGVTNSTSISERWLGSIQNGTYLQYSLPDELTAQFEVKGYRLHSLSIGDYNKDRAPRSWAIYGHASSTATPDDAGWVLIDEQADVQWPFETGNYDSTVPATQYVLEFSLASPATYRAYKFVPLSSDRSAANDNWTTGLMELVYLGNESADGYVVVQGAPGDLFEGSPGYGIVPSLETGTNILFTAPAVGYADNVRYRCAGYVLEKLGSDGAWVLDGTNLNANSYAYVGDGSGQRVTWLWEVDGYKLTAGLEFDGTESVTAVPEAEADGYYAAGTEVTLTPVIPEDSSNTFRNWYGDVPEGSEMRNPLVLTMDAARTVYANFNRNWRLVEGAANQITDGSWVLRINPLNNGTCSLGVDANTRAVVSGSGHLDLTGAVDDTRLTISTVATNAFRGNATMLSVALPDTVKFIRTKALRTRAAHTHSGASCGVRTASREALAQCGGPYGNHLLAAVAPSLRRDGRRHLVPRSGHQRSRSPRHLRCRADLPRLPRKVRHAHPGIRRLLPHSPRPQCPLLPRRESPHRPQLNLRGGGAASSAGRGGGAASSAGRR